MNKAFRGLMEEKTHIKWCTCVPHAVKIMNFVPAARASPTRRVHLVIIDEEESLASKSEIIQYSFNVSI